MLRHVAERNAQEFEEDPQFHRRVKTNYWFDEQNGKFGPMLRQAAHAIRKWRSQGIRFDAIIWSQGESDAIHLMNEIADHYAHAQSMVFQRLLWLSGARHIYIQELGRIDPPTAAYVRGVNCLRQAQRSESLRDSRIRTVTTTFDLPLKDGVHLTDAGYNQAAARMAIDRQWSNGVISIPGV